MVSWLDSVEAVVAVHHWMLAATLVSASLTGVLCILAKMSTNARMETLTGEATRFQNQLNAMKRTAEEIRKELLETQQHQDINQLKLKTSKSSAEELRQALVDAKRRLDAAQKAVNAYEAQAAQNDAGDAPASDDPPREPVSAMTGIQEEQLIDLLDPGPKGNVDIFCVMDDQTSVLTAKRLDAIMTADGWKTGGVSQSAYATPPEGLVLAINSKETAPSYSSFLQRIFATIGMPVVLRTDERYREWSLTIIVGTFDS